MYMYMPKLVVLDRVVVYSSELLIAALPHTRKYTNTRWHSRAREQKNFHMLNLCFSNCSNISSYVYMSTLH